MNRNRIGAIRILFCLLGFLPICWLETALRTHATGNCPDRTKQGIDRHAHAADFHLFRLFLPSASCSCLLSPDSQTHYRRVRALQTNTHAY